MPTVSSNQRMSSFLFICVLTNCFTFQCFNFGLELNIHFRSYPSVFSSL